VAPAWIGAAYPVQVIGETIRDVHVGRPPNTRLVPVCDGQTDRRKRDPPLYAPRATEAAIALCWFKFRRRDTRRVTSPCVVTPLDDQAAHARLRHVPPPRLSTCAAALGANGSRAERADQFAAPQRHSLKHDWRWWCCSSCCGGVWPTQQARCTAATAQRSDASRIR
jgi:hypothetical protein